MEHTFAMTAALIIATSVFVAGAFALADTAEEEKSAAVIEAENEMPQEETPEMMLGIFEGKLALYIGKSRYPDTVYDFFVRNLPPEDQNLLSEGIKISSEEELSKILEDFMS